MYIKIKNIPLLFFELFLTPLGKQMAIDYTTLQSDLKIKSGSKVMMLGLKVAPEDEQMTLTIKKVIMRT